MNGFWALARKEVLEQRRSWTFLALAGVFTALALLTTIVPFIVALFQDWDRGADDARSVLLAFGFVTIALGTLLAIIVSMGSLAGERASGTAAMTMSKPVTRFAFVSAKFVGLVLSIFAALAIASVIKYVLTLFMFDDGGLVGFAHFIAIIGVYLVFIGSIAFFWSGMFSRQLLAGGIALVIFIALFPLSEIPHTQRYWPINTVEWAENVFPEVEGAQGPIDEVIVSSLPLIVVGRDSLGREVAVPVDHGPIDQSALTLQRFEQLRLELADIEDIDGLAPRIIGGGPVSNPESRRHAEVMVIGLDPRYLEGFGALTFTSGGEARLEDLAEDQVYIDEQAARELDAQVRDELILILADQPVSIEVKGVVKAHGLADHPHTLIVPLERAQAMMRLDDGISDIVVSNRGDEKAGADLSEEVTRKLRVLFADSTVTSRLKELLDDGRVLNALERRQKSLFGIPREDVALLRDELQREGVSERLVGVLADPNIVGQVVEALERDGLDDITQEALTLLSQVAEFRVFDVKRRSNEDSDNWSAFAIAGGLIPLLGIGA